MSTKKIFNWGVLGPGKIAHKFVQDLLTLPNARLHAVASRSIDRAREFADKYDATHAYGSYGDLVNCPDLDVVYIATPHNSHCENTLLLLKNKIPVLCEKPMGINQEEVQQMIATSREQETYLMEALWTRFLPVFQKVTDIVESGQIGEVLTLKADFVKKGQLEWMNQMLCCYSTHLERWPFYLLPFYMRVRPWQRFMEQDTLDLSILLDQIKAAFVI